MKTLVRNVHNRNNTAISGIISTLIMLFSFMFILIGFNSNMIHAGFVLPGGGGGTSSPRVLTSVSTSSTSNGVTFEGKEIQRYDKPDNWAKFRSSATYSGSFRPVDENGDPAQPTLDYAELIYNGSSTKLSCKGGTSVYYEIHFGISDSIYESCYNNEAYIEVPGNFGDTLEIKAMYSLGVGNLGSSGKYTITRYISDNEAPIIHKFDISNGASLYDGNRYVRGNQASIYLWWQELNYQSHSITVDGNSISCPVTLGSSEQSQSKTFNCDISSIPVSFSTQHTMKITINDSYSHSTSAQFSFYKVDDSRKIVISDAYLRFNGTAKNNVIDGCGSGSDGEATINYTVTNPQYLDKYNQSLYVGDDGNPDHNFFMLDNYQDESEFITSDTYVSTDHSMSESGWTADEWVRDTSCGNITAYFRLWSVYGDETLYRIPLFVDCSDPTINSISVSRSDNGVSNGWTNTTRLTVNASAYDSYGIYQYDLYEYKSGEDIVETNSESEKNRLVNNGYRCLIGAGSYNYRCSKKVPAGYKNVRSNSSGSFDYTFSTPAQDGVFSIKVCAVDYVYNEICEENTSMKYDSISPSITGASTSTGHEYNGIRYIEGNNIKETISYSESRLDTSYLECSFDGTAVPCSIYSGNFVSGNTTISLDIDIKRIPIDFDSTKQLYVYIKDSAGNVGYKNLPLRKIDGSRKVNINSFNIRADGASIDNVIGSASGGNLSFNYTLSNDSYKDTSYTRVSVGGNSISDSNYAFSTGSYVNSGAYLNKGSTWINRFSDGEVVRARIQFRNNYGQYSSFEKDVSFDLSGPTISSIQLVRDDKSSVKWTNRAELYMTINASDIHGVSNYEVLQDEHGGRTIVTEDSRYAQSLRQQGYKCLLENGMEGNGVYRCKKYDAPSGYYHIAGSGSKEIHFYPSVPTSNSVFDLQGCATDKVGNRTCRVENSIYYDDAGPIVTSINIVNGTTHGGNRYIDTNSMLVDITYNEERLDANYLSCYVDSNIVPCSVESGYSFISSSNKTTRINVNVGGIGVNFDTSVSLKVQIKDSARNVGYNLASFFRINTSRVIGFNSFNIRAKEAHKDNIIGNLADGNISFNYSITNSSYLDQSYSRASVGGNDVTDSNYAFSTGEFVVSNQTLRKDNWMNKFSNNQTIIARIRLRNIYGQLSDASQTVKVDYANPNISAFKVSGVNDYWTNRLTAFADITASDENDIKESTVMQTKIQTEVATSDARYAQSLRQQGYMCYLIDPNSPYQTCIKKEEDNVAGSRVDTKGGYSVRIKPISQGKTLHFILTVVDYAGNKSISSYDSLKYDSVSPQEITVSFASGNYIQSLNKIFTNNEIIKINYSANDVSSGIKTIKVIDEVDGGIYTLESAINSTPGVKEGCIDFNIHDFKYNDIHFLKAQFIDYAENVSEVEIGCITFDNQIPTFEYEIVNDSGIYFKPYLDYTYVTKINEESTYHRILNKDISYFISVKELASVDDIPATHWIEESESTISNKNAYIALPRHSFNLYIRLSNLKDYADNSIKNSNANYHYITIPFEAIRQAIEPFPIEDNTQEISRMINNSFEIPSDKILLWSITSNDNSFNANDFTFNGFANKLKNSTNLLAFNIAGKTYNSKSSGTFAYDDIFIISKDHKFNDIVDVILIITAPIISGNVANTPINTNLTLNQGDDISNFGLSFTSPLNMPLDVESVISLNGERVEKIDTNIPGTYSVRTKAKDLMGQTTYIDQTLVVKEDKKEINTKEIVKEEVLVKEVLKDNTTNNTINNQKVEENKVDELTNPVARLTNASDLETIKGGKDSILEKAQIFTFKLFSKYFFKVYDG